MPHTGSFICVVGGVTCRWLMELLHRVDTGVRRPPKLIRNDRTPQIKSIEIQCHHVLSFVPLSSPVRSHIYLRWVISQRSTTLFFVSIRQEKPNARQTCSKVSAHYFPAIICPLLIPARPAAVMRVLSFPGNDQRGGRLQSFRLRWTRIHDALNWNFPSVNTLHHKMLLTGGA